MSARPRTSSKKDRRRESRKPILAAAEKVFPEADFGRAGMRSITEMARLPETNLHHSFPAKEALYRRDAENIFPIPLQATGIFTETGAPVEGIGVET